MRAGRQRGGLHGPDEDAATRARGDVHQPDPELVRGAEGEGAPGAVAALAEAHRAVNATGDIDGLGPLLPEALESRCVRLGLRGGEVPVQIQDFTFGSIQIGGVTYEHDVVIDGGQVRKRKQKASKSLRASFGHTPLSAHKDIPWTCR